MSKWLFWPEGKPQWRILLVFLCVLHLGRALYFASGRGAEQDSSWYLGVSKILAERGLYASYLNVVLEEGRGGLPNIQGRYSVQDEKGLIHFPEGVTVGPGYVLPEALLIKIFGAHTWVYRLWPFLTYSALFILLFSLLLTHGGPVSLILFFVWNWCFPQLAINYAYEAYSESTALLFLLAGWLILADAHTEKERGGPYKQMFASGLLFSFAVLTKTLFWLYIGSFLLAFLWVCFMGKGRKALLPWSAFGGGLLLPVLSFELYRYLYLTSLFGQNAYELANKSLKHVFRTAGSGLSQVGQMNWESLWKGIQLKYGLWEQLGFNDSTMLWIILAMACLVPIPPSDKSKKAERERGHFGRFLLLMKVGMLIHLVWYLALCSTGWFRHAWAAMVMALWLICLGLGQILQQRRVLPSIMVMALLIWAPFGLVVGYKFFPAPAIAASDVDFWHMLRQPEGKPLGLPCTQIFPKAEQEEVVKFLERELRTLDRLYYLDMFYGVELAPYLNRVFYPVGRFFNISNLENMSGRGLLVFSPYNRGEYPYSYVNKDYFKANVKKYCLKELFSNSYYYVCSMN